MAHHSDQHEIFSVSYWMYNLRKEAIFVCVLVSIRHLARKKEKNDFFFKILRIFLEAKILSDDNEFFSTKTKLIDVDSDKFWFNSIENYESYEEMTLA